MSILEAVAERSAQQRADQENTFRRLVVLTADNEGDQDQILADLTACGKSPEELAQAVQVYRRRLALYRQLESAQDTEAERQRLTQQIKEADAEFSQAQQRHQQTVAPLLGELQRLDALAAGSKFAYRELKVSISQSLRERLRIWNAKRDELHQRRATLMKQMTDLVAVRRNNAERKAEDEVAEVSQNRWTTNHQLMQHRESVIAAELAKPSTQLERMAKELALLEAVITEHGKHYAALEAEMLTP